MSRNAYPAAVLRRRRWPLLLPIVLVPLLAAGWAGFWFYAAARAETEIAAWRAREHQQQRLQDCASQSIRGFPFRIEVRCVGARFALRGTPTLRLMLPSILVAVQIYDPSLLISEFAGPLEISETENPPSYVANWSLGQASVRGLPSAVQRASLVFDAPTVRDPGLAGNNVIFRAQRMELHGRPAAGSTAGYPAIESVLRLTGAVAEKLHSLAEKPVDAEVNSVLHGGVDISPKAWPERWREWQARDGHLEIVKARVAQEDVIAAGAGVLKLTPRGRLDGSLQVTVVGIEKVLKMFDIERIMSEGQIGATLGALDRLIPGLGGLARQSAGPGLVAALGQRTLLEGKPAVAFPVRFADGAIFLGPFRVGEVPPLF